jgi:hypothetical protein
LRASGQDWQGLVLVLKPYSFYVSAEASELALAQVPVGMVVAFVIWFRVVGLTFPPMPAVTGRASGPWYEIIPILPSTPARFLEKAGFCQERNRPSGRGGKLGILIEYHFLCRKI